MSTDAPLSSPGEVPVHFDTAFNRLMPEHASLWTSVGVAAFGEPQMQVEARVVAIVPDQTPPA